MAGEMLKSCRRVVSGINRDGRSDTVLNTVKSDVQTLPALPGFRWLDLWSSESCPAPYAGTADRASDAPIFPGAEGSVFRIFEIDPDPESQRETYRSGDTHPLMNSEATLDMIYVMAGEITVVFEDGEAHLEAGDVFIQQGTRHAWSNRSKAPCRMLAVLIGGEKAGS